MEPTNSSNSSYEPFIAINVLPIFAPLKMIAYLEVDAEDSISLRPFRECIQEQMEKNLPYLIALVQDEGSSKTYCFDAVDLCDWNKSSPSNPQTNKKIQNIFIFALTKYSGTSIDCFHFLGTSKEVDLESPDLECIKQDSFIKTGDYFEIDTRALFAPLKTGVFFNISKIKPLIDKQKDKNLPYLLAIVKEENVNDIQCFDALTLYKNKDPRLEKAFIYLLNSTESVESGKFQYLGANAEGELQDFIQTLLDPINSQTNSLFNVYKNYEAGKHVEINIQEGINWLKRAAERGHAFAQFVLNKHYSLGKELKADFEEADYAPNVDIQVLPIFAPFKAIAYMDVNAKAKTSCSFRECIQEQMKKNLPYLIALVQDEGSFKTFCFDALEINDWKKYCENKKTSVTNPFTIYKIQNIFIFAITKYSGTSIDYFHYLGTSKEVDLESPKLEHIKQESFIKKGGFIEINTSTLFAPLKTSSFFSIHETESITNISFTKLINEQKEKNLPYLLAIVKDEKKAEEDEKKAKEDEKKAEEKASEIPKKISNIQCFDALTLYKNKDLKLEKAFIYLLNSTEKVENGKFQYLGAFNAGGDLHDFISTLFNPINSKPEALFKVYENYKAGKYVVMDIQEGIKWLRRAAEKGDISAQYELGSYYFQGLELKLNMIEVLKWWKSAADKGHPSAQGELGYCYLHEKRVKKDENLGIKYLKLAEKNNDAQGMCFLGFSYATGFGVKVNFAEAVKLWQRSSEKGFHFSRLFLAASLLEGKGIDQNIEEGKKILSEMKEKGDLIANFLLLIFNDRDQRISFENIINFIMDAEHNLPQALYNFGSQNEQLQIFNKAFSWWEASACNDYEPAKLRMADCFFKGNFVSQDYKMAVKWWVSASLAQNSAAANYHLGVCCFNGFGVEKNVQLGMTYTEKASAQGNADAEHVLAVCYLNGMYVEKDVKKGLIHLTKSAEQGGIRAQHELALCYMNGKHVKKDEKTGLMYLTKSAEQGYAPAQCSLAIFYLNGKPTKQNQNTGISYYTKSAEQGYAKAQCELGIYYMNGKFVEKNEEIGVSYLILSAGEGYPKAEYELAVCYINGWFVKKDEENGIYYLTRSAEQRYAQAQYQLGMFYLEGKFVPKDPEKAKNLLKLAKDQGYKPK